MTQPRRHNSAKRRTREDRKLSSALEKFRRRRIDISKMTGFCVHQAIKENA